MTPEQFVYWLQGYAELADCAELTAKQWGMVKGYLALVSLNDARRKILDDIEANNRIIWGMEERAS